MDVVVGYIGTVNQLSYYQYFSCTQCSKLQFIILHFRRNLLKP